MKLKNLLLLINKINLKFNLFKHHHKIEEVLKNKVLLNLMKLVKLVKKVLDQVLVYKWQKVLKVIKIYIYNSSYAY